MFSNGLLICTTALAIVPPSPNELTIPSVGVNDATCDGSAHADLSHACTTMADTFANCAFGDVLALVIELKSSVSPITPEADSV
jgi:hypothetical protein